MTLPLAPARIGRRRPSPHYVRTIASNQLDAQSMPSLRESRHLCAVRIVPPTVRHRYLWAFVPLLAMLASLAACKEKPKEAALLPPTPVRVDTVRLVAANSVTRYSGTVRPRIEADIGFRVGGKVIERKVDVGSHVEAGTTLGRL